MDYVIAVHVVYGYGLGIAQEHDPEEGRTVTNLRRSPSGRKTVTIFS